MPLNLDITIKDLSVNENKANSAGAGSFCEISVNLENQNLF